MHFLTSRFIIPTPYLRHHLSFGLIRVEVTKRNKKLYELPKWCIDCKKSTCAFTHPYWRKYSGTRTINELKDWTTRENNGAVPGGHISEASRHDDEQGHGVVDGCIERVMQLGLVSS
jgi:hypothetical protein